MKKKLIVTAIVQLIIAWYLFNTWMTIINENYEVLWQHITGLLLFIPLPILLFKNYRLAVLSTGIYLAIALLRGLSLTAGIMTGSMTIAGLKISGFNWLALGLLILFGMLHLGTLIEMQLDYKETKANNKQG